MNKFTRSQMGKIMAYALSAAMAVTVVPTYMMKPLTVMADEALTKTVKNANGGEETGENLAITSLDEAEANATIKFYVSESANLIGSVTDNESNLGDAIPGNITPGETDATVSIASLKEKATTSGNYTIYYAYSKDNTDVSSSTLVKAGTIEVTATTSGGTGNPGTEQPGPSGSQFGITAASVKQGSVLYDATSNVTSTSKVCLYSKVGDKKAAYVLDAVDYNGDRDYEIVVPYSVPAGKYYMSSNEEETDGISANAQVLEVKAATPITGVTLNATNTDIYYFGAAES